MDIKKILSTCDHTLLKQTSTWAEIKEICDDGIKYKVASVCIPPSFVKQAKDYVGDQLAVCTVIGFPNGYMTTATKVFETKDALANGADEIDMVVNLGYVKDRHYDLIEKEIMALKEACGKHLLKVIIETCFLTEEEKIELCKIVGKAKADFIKTSTGFGGGGATLEDIKLFVAHKSPVLKMKASGGIRDLDMAKAYLELGVERLGTSAIVKIVKEEKIVGDY